MSIFNSIFSSKDSSVLTKSLYEELFKKWYAPLCKMIVRMVKEADIAEDIVQEAYITLWEKRGSIKIEAAIKSYLYRTAINAAYSYLEKNKRYPTLQIESIETELEAPIRADESLTVEEISNQINKLLLQLPEACREVFILSRMEGMSYKEIAETLDISIKTVENQMGKALKAFRSGLL